MHGPATAAPAKSTQGGWGEEGAEGSSFPPLTLYRQWPEQPLFHRIITMPLCIPRRNQPRETVIPCSRDCPHQRSVEGLECHWKVVESLGGTVDKSQSAATKRFTRLS